VPGGLARFLAVLPALVAAGMPGVALAQGHAGGGRLPTPELLAGITHAIVQGSAVFIAGLAALVALVWLPVSRSSSIGAASGGVFARGAWVLFAVLAVAVFADVCVYTVRVTGTLSPALLFEGFFGTGVGRESLARVVVGLLAVMAAAWAARGRDLARWWVAAGVGGLLLATLVTESHAAAQGIVPMLVIWLHLVAAALWMGGLLAFPLLLLGPLRALELDERADMRRRVVRRFSRVATVAVGVILLTGAYSALLNVSGPLALIGTAYGRALIMKLGLTVLLLATGGINFVDKGSGPLGRMVGLELVLAGGIFVAAGFLTSLPPAN
jgi:copper transport protein